MKQNNENLSWMCWDILEDQQESSIWLYKYSKDVDGFVKYLNPKFIKLMDNLSEVQISKWEEDNYLATLNKVKQTKEFKERVADVRSHCGDEAARRYEEEFYNPSLKDSYKYVVEEYRLFKNSIHDNSYKFSAELTLRDCLDAAMYRIFGKGSAKINKICTREELEAVYTILNMVQSIDGTQRYMERLLQCGAPHDDKDVINCIERLKGFEEYRKKIPFTNEKLNTMEKLTENCRSSRMKSFLEDFLRSPWRDKGDIYRRGRRLRGAGFSRQ